MAYAPATSSSTSSASGLLNRNISTATGVSAITAPASSPAAGPNQRRTVGVEHADRGDAHSASGTRMRPRAAARRRRTDSAISHSDAGVLSTVMELPASEEPKKNAFQLCEPAWAAAE